MQLIAKDAENFELLSANKQLAGKLIYKNNRTRQAIIITDKEYNLNFSAPGIWNTCASKNNEALARIKVKTLGTMRLETLRPHTIYNFKKSTGWKLRFMLLNNENEELLALLPVINWGMRTYGFSLQLNEEFSGVCDAFIILHALHCAICSMSMMNGSMTAAIAVT